MSKLRTNTNISLRYCYIGDANYSKTQKGYSPCFRESFRPISNMRCRKVAEKDKNVVKGASLRFWHFKAILWVRLDLSNNTFEHLCSLGRFACKFQQKIFRGDKKIQTQGCWVRRVLCPPPPLQGMTRCFFQFSTNPSDWVEILVGVQLMVMASQKFMYVWQRFRLPRNLEC